MAKPVFYDLKPMPKSRVSRRKLIVAGHRGAMAVAPENTLPAFEAALEAGADGVEFDIQRTSDGHLVIFHDEEVSRTSDGSGLLQEMTLAELKALDVGLYFGEEFRGTRIMTLPEFFEWAQGNNLLLFPELKEPFRYPGIEQQVAKMIQEYELIERTQTRSFYHDYLHALHLSAPEIPISELWRENLPAPEDFTYPTLDLQEDFYTQELIDHLHTHGRTLTAWVVDDLNRAKQLIEWGIDGITTNDPARLLSILDAYESEKSRENS